MFTALFGKLVAVGLTAAASGLTALLFSLTKRNATLNRVVKNQEVEQFIIRQIQAVKEKAAEQIKKKVPVSALLTADQKLQMVVSEVVDKFPGISTIDAELLTKALLAQVGEGAAASLEKVADHFGLGGGLE